MAAVLPLTKAVAEKFAGHWVAVKDETVIAAALTAEELLRRVREDRLEPDLVLRVPAPSDPQTWIF